MMVFCTALFVGLLIALCGWADCALQLRSTVEKLDALSAAHFPEFDIAPRDQA